MWELEGPYLNLITSQIRILRTEVPWLAQGHWLASGRTHEKIWFLTQCSFHYPLLSLLWKFEATNIYRVLIRYKTVGWILLEKQKLKKGPYHEPFYNLVSRKTCMQKTIENVCKNKVHEKLMWQWTPTWRTGFGVTEPFFLCGRVVLGVQSWGHRGLHWSQKLFPAQLVGLQHRSPLTVYFSRGKGPWPCPDQLQVFWAEKEEPGSVFQTRIYTLIFS